MNAQARHGPEYTECQRPAYELLRDAFGYRFAEGADLLGEREGGSERQVILRDTLARKLRQINGDIADATVAEAIRALEPPGAGSLIEINQQLHTLLSRWATIEVRTAEGSVGRSVRYIDFDNPENNDFLVAEEFTVRGPDGRKRADLVIFVNGIPVVVIECKEPGNRNGIAEAVGDLRTYQEEIPRLFYTAHFTIALKGTDARYGTVGTEVKYYRKWEDPFPIAKDDLGKMIGRPPLNQDFLLAGLLSKANLLEMLRTFVVFDTDGGRVVKKVARYQQYQAVNLAMERILDQRDNRPLRERGGTIWHTQGSGKSLTMLWLALKLRREPALDNPTLLVCTDRTDLDRQITETFQNCGFENPVQATRTQHLRELLSEGGGRTVLTTIHKFRADVDEETGRSVVPLLSDADNIFALVDEAHRTEYGKFAAQMKVALPNACRIAFTGTPIAQHKKGRVTVEEFGPYIHKYTMPQSEADDATLPILYESRLPELAVWGKRLEPLFDAETADLTPEQRERLKKQELTERAIAEAGNRIELIAYDMYEHYRTHIEPNGFKAQVAACSQDAAARYFEELERFLPGRVAMLISEPKKKATTKLTKLKEKFSDEKRIIDQFKHEGVDKLAIIVVVDKYLTGFDAPAEQVLYLDKPLKEHNLLQAIARVNRPADNKEWGLVVDYWGVSLFLDRALACFEQQDREDIIGMLAERATDDIYDDLQKRLRAVFSFFPAGLSRDSTEPWIEVLEPQDERALFDQEYGRFMRTLDRLLPDERALDYVDDARWIKRVRDDARAQYYVEDLDLVDASAKIKALLDTHIRGEEVVQLLEPVPILSDRFQEEVAKLTSARAKAKRMEHALRHVISEKYEEDPAFYESIKDRLERIIRERKEQRLSEVEQFKLLTEQTERVQRRARTATEADPYLGIIRRHYRAEGGGDEEPTEQEQALGQEILDILKKERVVDWLDKPDVQREMRRVVKRRLRSAGCPADKVEELTTALIEVAQVRLA